MEMLQGVWKQHLRPRAVVGYGLKIFLPSPPNYVTRSPGGESGWRELTKHTHLVFAYGLSEFPPPYCLKEEIGSHFPLPLKMRPYILSVINNSAELLIGDTKIVVTRKNTSVAMEKIYIA